MKYIYLILFCFIINICWGQVNLSIPNSITKPEERAVYLVQHYWDSFDFSDISFLGNPDETEQAFVNYIDLMKYVKPEVAGSSLTKMVGKTTVNKDVQTYFFNLFEKYLYDSESPLYNEELYIPILQSFLSSPSLDEVEKIRPAQLLGLLSRNRVGEEATDFVYTLKDGQTASLHKLDSEFLLLYFYDPDCHNCQETVRQLSASQVVSGLIAANRLKVLAVYAEGDVEVWKKHLSFIPSAWINSYDATMVLKNDELYDLKSMPTLYLLDRTKKVLLKNVSGSSCLEFLQKQF